MILLLEDSEDDNVGDTAIILEKQCCSKMVAAETMESEGG